MSSASAGSPESLLPRATLAGAVESATYRIAVLKGVLRSLGRTLLWPFRRFFDPRFGGIEQVIGAKHEDLAARLDDMNRRLDIVAANVDHFMILTTDQLQEFRSLLAATIDTTNESSIVVGRTLSELLNAADETREAIERTAEELEALRGIAKAEARL